MRVPRSGGMILGMFLALMMVGMLPIVFLAALYALAWWFLSESRGGRTIYAIGSNPEAARVAGLRVEAYRAQWINVSFGQWLQPDYTIFEQYRLDLHTPCVLK